MDRQRIQKDCGIAGKHHAGTSKFITGTSQKVHKGTRWVGKKIKKYPKTSAALGGAVAWDILDRDD